MPKDNEVDEKAVAWMNPESRDVINAERKHAWLHYFGSPGEKQAAAYTEPLTYAATVAELRAEVERLRGINSSLVDKCNRLNLCGAQSEQRADAAERRVGELEAKARNWDDLIAARAETARDPDDAEWKMLARQGRKIEAVRACRALHGYSLTEAINCVEALTGADPT